MILMLKNMRIEELDFPERLCGETITQLQCTGHSKECSSMKFFLANIGNVRQPSLGYGSVWEGCELAARTCMAGWGRIKFTIILVHFFTFQLAW